jgi:hypothetical protein
MPANHVLIAEPSTADNDTEQRASGLIVAAETLPSARVHRGVILAIGEHVGEPHAEVGGVVHYQQFIPIGVGESTLHVVPDQYAIAFERGLER